MQAAQFLNLKAVATLKKLAQNPYDLTKENNLTPERLNQFVAESAGYKLLYGTERIDKEVIQALNDLAQESKAVEKMEKMQSGEVMNFIQGFPSEQREVLHTATRDFFDHPNAAPKAKEASQKAKKELDKLKAFIEKIDKENQFTDLVTIGIGGSDLGPRANYIALQYLAKKGRKVHFISNVDPDDMARVVQKLDPKKTLAVVISKSGTTLETATNEALVRHWFEKAGIDSKKSFISISCEGTPLDDKNKYLECFHLWEWIGGRFCTSSMAGGVLLSFAYGFDVYMEFLKGAHAMDRAALNRDVNKNLPLLGALLQIWNHNFLNFPTTVIVPYSQGLLRYAAHVQQVEMESNGKRIDQEGHPVKFQTCPIIWGEPGTNAQHSFFQLLHQGTIVAPIEFIGYKQNQYGKDLDYEGTNSQEKLLSNLFAQSLALATGLKSENPNKEFPGNRPSHILLAKQLTPYTVGALLAYYEHVAAFQGFVWGINSFDQEGVQLGKILAKKVLECFTAQRGKRQASYKLGEAYLKHLDSL